MVFGKYVLLYADTEKYKLDSIHFSTTELDEPVTHAPAFAVENWAMV